MSGCSSIKGALSAGARHDISQSSVTIDIYIYIETRGYIYIAIMIKGALRDTVLFRTRRIYYIIYLTYRSDIAIYTTGGCA